MIDTIRTHHPEVTKKSADEFLRYMDTTGRMIKHKAGISFFLTLNDFMLDRIRKHSSYVMKDMQMLMRCKGRNIFIFAIMKDDRYKDKVNLLRELNKIITEKQPKSVSWWNNNQTKFYYKEC